MGIDNPYRSVDQPYEDDRRAAERYIDELRRAAESREAQQLRQDEFERRHRRIVEITSAAAQQAALEVHAILHPSLGEIGDERDADRADAQRLADETSFADLDSEDEPDAGDRVIRFFDEFAEHLVTDTFKTFGKAAFEHAAYVAGLGLPLMVVDVAVKAVEWSQVAEGDGAVEISVPIPLGSGVDLELSAHPADGQDGPPLTVCCAPSDGSAVGVAQIGPFEVAPSTEQHERAHQNSGHAGDADAPRASRRWTSLTLMV
jgi:hypothetical protein